MHLYRYVSNLWSRNMTLTATCADFNTFACSVYPIWPLHPKLTGVEAVISKFMATCQATSACMYDRSLRLLGEATTASELHPTTSPCFQKAVTLP